MCGRPIARSFLSLTARALYGISREVPNPEPTNEHRERQIDALIAKSKTWIRAQAAIAAALARHPAAALAAVPAVPDRDRVVARLMREGASAGDAAVFADLWIQYRDASAVVSGGGAGAIRAARLRDSARAGMRRLPWIDAEWLWAGGVEAADDE